MFAFKKACWLQRLIISLVICLLPTGGTSEVKRIPSRIIRLTYTHDGMVRYPSLSDNGDLLLYIHEIKDKKDPLRITRSLRILEIKGGKEKILFTDGKLKAPSPYEGTLVLGSKPPLLSGNGKRCAFTLALPSPFPYPDHFLGIMDIDGGNLQVVDLKIESLQSFNWRHIGFKGDSWARVAGYAMSQDGKRAACLMKGDMGKGCCGYPSGIVLIDTEDLTTKTLLAPQLEEGKWRWRGYPRNPLMGGGWVFNLSTDGELILFGAQASPKEGDYDLYIINRDGSGLRRLTTFHEPYVVLGHLSGEGAHLVFYYAGKGREGVGTYLLDLRGEGINHLRSRVTERLDYEGISGDGRYIFYSWDGRGMRYSLQGGEEVEIFSPQTPGYVRSGLPMTFPPYPAYFPSRISSFRGERVLIVGTPMGKGQPEVYLVIIGEGER